MTRRLRIQHAAWRGPNAPSRRRRARHRLAIPAQQKHRRSLVLCCQLQPACSGQVDERLPARQLNKHRRHTAFAHAIEAGAKHVARLGKRQQSDPPRIDTKLGKARTIRSRLRLCPIDYPDDRPAPAFYADIGEKQRKSARRRSVRRFAGIKFVQRIGAKTTAQPPVRFLFDGDRWELLTRFHDRPVQ